MLKRLDPNHTVRLRHLLTLRERYVRLCDSSGLAPNTELIDAQIKDLRGIVIRLGPIPAPCPVVRRRVR